MKSFNSYISQQSNSFNYDINYVNESLENNVRMINEAKLITEHGKDIDNLLYKFKTYTYNNLYNANSLNESDNTYKLSLNEQQTFRDLMIFICEDYRNKLLEELNIYESLIIDGQLITEGKLFDKVKNKSKNLVANIKQTWELGKDKVNQAIEALKTKIKEVNELIKDFAQKAISTVKEMAVKLIGLLQKFDCTLADLFSKMGFNTDEEEKSVDEIGQQLASNPDYLKKNDVYESYVNSLNIISEDDSTQGQGNQNIKDKGETQKQAEKKSTKQMLWESFKQLMIWAGVCVVIPGFVCGLFPGTFIALLVPIVCKLLWNGYKIYKLVKQWKTVRQEWGNYKKSQKIITVIGMIASIVALFFNFKSSFEALGKIWEAFVKSGGDLFANANLGIQPDVLTRAFGALVKMIKEGKFSFKDFGESFKAITDSFAEHIPGVDQVVKQAAKVGKSGQELLDEFEKGGFKGSTQAWKDVLKPASLDPSKVTGDGVYDVVFDGNFKSDEAQKLIKWFADNGVKITPEDAFNKGLNKINKLAGSVWGAKIPGDVLQKALDSGIKLGHNGWFSILGGMIDKVIPGEEIINAATSMLFTIPSVEWAPQNNGGFRVRLGGKDDKKNFVYEVAEDGVKKHKVSDYSKEYDKIKSKVAEVNKKFLEDLLKNDKLSDEEKNTVKEKLEKFNSEYKDKINDKECIVFYGTRVEDENTNESFKSLHDYLINEAINKYTIAGFIDTVSTINTLICKVYNVTNINDIKPDELDEKLKEFYDKNISDWINNIKKLNDELEKQNVKWCIADGKLSLDADLTDEKYKSIYKLLTVIAHPDKAQNLKNTCNTLVNTAQHIDTSDTDVFTKLFNGDELSEEETSKVTEFLKKKFTKLSDDDIKEIISKISELVNKTKNEQTNESLIDESVSDNDILNNLKKLKNYLQDKANAWEEKYRDTDKEYGVDSGKHKFAGNVYTLFSQIFKTEKKRKYDAKSDKMNNKDDILSDVELNAVSYFFQQYILTDISKGIHNLKKAFIGIIALKNWLLEHKNEDITNEVKALYLLIISIFERSETFKKDVENGKFEKLNFDIDDSTKEKVQQKLDQKVNDVSDKEAKSDLEEIQSKDSENKSNDTKDDNLLKIYKAMIKSFAQDDSFKTDVKNHEYELLDGVSIEESYKSLKQMFLLEKLEKSDFRKNLGKLKDYLLKQTRALVKKDKGGELQKTDDKHEVVLMQPKDVIKSMGVTYEPEEKKSDDSNVTTGELSGGKEIKQLPASVSDDDKNKDKKSENVPVLMLANNYGIDLANATKSGPREDIYALKGIFDSLTFIEIEGGTSIANITKMLGEILHAQTNNLYDDVANKPCIKEKGDKEFKLTNDKINKPETERPEFGMLTNQEVTDVLNKPKVADTIIKGKSSVYTIAKTKEDKDYVADKEAKYTKKLENPDEETVKLVKDAYPDAIDKDGKIKKDYKDKDGKTLPQIFAGYSLAQHKAKDTKKSGGLFSKLVNYVKNKLFGGDKEKGKKVNSALKHLDESLNEYDNFLEVCFARKTLAEYIAERKQ